MLTHFFKALSFNNCEQFSLDDFHVTELTILKGTETSIEVECLRALVDETTTIAAVNIDGDVDTLPSITGYHSNDGPFDVSGFLERFIFLGRLSMRLPSRNPLSMTNVLGLLETNRNFLCEIRKTSVDTLLVTNILDAMEATFEEGDSYMLGYTDFTIADILWGATVMKMNDLEMMDMNRWSKLSNLRHIFCDSSVDASSQT